MPWPTAAARQHSSRSYAACATQALARCVTRRCSGWGAAWPTAAQDTPCATRASRSCSKRLQPPLSTTVMYHWYVPARCAVARMFNLLRGVTRWAAGRGCRVPVVDQVHACCLAAWLDCGASVSNCDQASNVAQARQRSKRAHAASRHEGLRGRSDVVYQPHMEQHVCRHVGRHFAVFRGARRRCERESVVRHFGGRAARNSGTQQAVELVHDHVQEQHCAHRQPAAGCRRVEQPDSFTPRLVRTALLIAHACCCAHVMCHCCGVQVCSRAARHCCEESGGVGGVRCGHDAQGTAALLGRHTS